MGSGRTAPIENGLDHGVRYEAMVSKVLAVTAFVVLPFSLSLWHKSHSRPERFRYDITVYKSLRVYLKDGICGIRLLSMPTKTGFKGEGRLPLDANPAQIQSSFMLNTARQGPYRITWFVFPFWLSTLALVSAVSIPIIRGPLRRRWRRWRGACEACGYNLWGNRSGRCPECGLRFRGSPVRP